MKVQEIETHKGTRYILLDDEYLLIDLVCRYLKFMDNIGKSPNTLKNYAFHLKTYYEYLKIVGVNALDIFDDEMKPLDILSDFMVYLQYPYVFKKDLLEGRRTERSNSTVNIIMSTIESFYGYIASNNELERVNVYKSIKANSKYKSFLFEIARQKKEKLRPYFRKKTEKKPVKYITREQYTKLFSLCCRDRDRTLVALLFEGGLRVNEALGLHLEDLNNIEDNIIKIVPRENNENGARVKNYAAGEIYLPQYCTKLIIDYLSKSVIDCNSDFLFLNMYGAAKGTPMKISTVEKMFDKFSIQLGYNVHPHMLRHGFATEKLQRGWTLMDISKYLRHASINSTEVYTHVTNELKMAKIREFYTRNNVGCDWSFSW